MLFGGKMNSMYLLGISQLALLVLIAGIVVYQFVEERQALNRLDKALNPPDTRNGAEIFSDCLEGLGTDIINMTQPEIDERCKY